MSALSRSSGAPTALRDAPAVHPALADFSLLCENADPMPTLPRMGQVWRVLERAEIAVVTGVPADRVAREAAARVTEVPRG